MEVTLNSQGTQDIANSFKNVLVAIDKNDEIIAHTLFNNNATFEFNYDELNSLKTFSVLYVHNYNETNVTDIEVINNN
jgi:hypothetical protein